MQFDPILLKNIYVLASLTEIDILGMFKILKYSIHNKFIEYKCINLRALKIDICSSQYFFRKFFLYTRL